MDLKTTSLQQSQEHGVGFAAKAFGISRGTIQLWVNRFIQEGLEGLNYKKGRGRKGHLKEEHRDAMKLWLEENPTITLKEIVIRLGEDFEVNTSVSAVHRVIQEMNFSYITPRPVHHKQNKEEQEAFKKKSER